MTSFSPLLLGRRVTLRGLTALLSLLPLLIGCATASSPSEIPVADFKQLAGIWAGWTTASDGSPHRIRLIVQTNGRYWVSLDDRSGFHGQLALESGAVRYGTPATGSWRGRIILEDRGKEVMRFVQDTGETWVECERSP